MNDKQQLLSHFLATLAYRTRKALHGAPHSFASFSAGQATRTPFELVRHMSDVLNHARTFFGDPARLEPLPTYEEEVARFFEIVSELLDHLSREQPLDGTTPERLLQGPFSDAMTHSGQLAMLRRLSGEPIPPENFHDAEIDVVAQRGSE